MRSLFLLLILIACTPKPIPVWNGKLYVGNSQSRAMERAQSGESIPSDSPDFDSVIGMSTEDFRSFYTTYVLGCKQWKTKELSLDAYKKNIDAINKALDNQR